MDTQIVVAGIIERDGFILIAQRGFGSLAGKWEFPGGKVEKNEPPQQALLREIHEEFDVTIKVNDCIGQFPFDVDDKSCILIAYNAKHLSGDYKLKDHSQMKWVKPESLQDADLAPADIPVAYKVTAV